jgi:chromosome partitioning protein
MSIISVINQKGGVAKTTTSVNVAACWAKSGKKVLLIDLDPQSSATKSIFGDQEFEQTIYDVIIDKLPPEKAIVYSEAFGIDVLPSEIMLSGVDIQIAAHFGRERILKSRIEHLKRKYDAILIDCPPSLGLLTVNALMASKDIVIPICPEYFSAKGIDLILETTENLWKGLGHKIDVRGIVITRYKDRKVANRVIEEIREKHGIKIFKDYIPDSINVEESHHEHLPVYKYDPKGRATEAYLGLARDLWR